MPLSLYESQAVSATLTHSRLCASPPERVESPYVQSVGILWPGRPKQRRNAAIVWMTVSSCEKSLTTA